ncbi:hypothetical protein GCM10007301_52990 [Azorhizobium oxalatiphilum]|uniref:CHAT domain-containing protein n=1 Tax=Azorhizobium oxalatiphilum TaxID=980631 RepID=A0A917CGX1_9HYPH|nr:CHAT domain-containing protein [Azorhizobium oxalatiphilum]GGF86506.1 hypothetical protein GCM10007301_52990 [Azorhizobium oxalatiphilum]
MSGLSVSRISVLVALGAGLLASAPARAQTQTFTPRLDGCEQMLAKGDRAQGVPCLRRALKTLAAGTDDDRTLTAYREWAEAFQRSRETETAKALFEEGLATRAAQKPSIQLGLLHFYYSYRLLQHTPDTAASLDHARKALDILERMAGPDAYDTISARDNLASQLTNSGAIALGLNLAEANYEAAERALGEDEPLTWRTANNFAEGLRSIGRPEAAVPIDRMLLRKRIKHYGEGSIQALVSASNQGLNYLELGDKEQALRHFDLQARFGKKLADPRSEHEAQGYAWATYAAILFDPDRQTRPKSLETLTEIKNWRSAPELMQVKAAQLAATVAEKQGKVRQGLSLREAAYEISKATYTERNPLTFDALLGVAEAHVRNQEPDKALALFIRLDTTLHAWALQEIGTSGNRFIAETTRVLADNFLYAFGRFALAEPSARSAFADAAGRWKTMESGTRVRLRQMVDQLPDDLRPQAQEVIRLMGQQQEVLSERRSAADRVADAALAADAKAKLATLEARLKDMPAPSGMVAEALADKDALVNFVVITRRAGLRSSADAIEDVRLVAVVRRKGLTPALHDYGPLDGIADRLVAERKPKGEDTRDAGKEKAGGAGFNDVLLAPLAGALGGAERLFIVPSAELYAVPFPLLRDDAGRYLDERFEVHILTREDAVLTAGRNDRLASGGKALLAGGLDFSSGKEKGARALPATAREVSQIDTVLASAGYSTTLLTGAAGTEPALKAAIPQASIVHLATHGFFEEPERGVSALWRAGLVLARSGDDKPPRPNPTDGFLYAQELMGWDLSAVDLVVLSACETGAGDESAVSAIRGLPTALGIAGARRSLLTLWPVADTGAANFMIAFYKHAAEPGTTYAAALRQTRRDAIAGKIRGAEDPDLWASFVMFEG